MIGGIADIAGIAGIGGYEPTAFDSLHESHEKDLTRRFVCYILNVFNIS